MTRFIRIIITCSFLGSLLFSACVQTWESIIPAETATLLPSLTPTVTPLPVITAIPSHTLVIPDSGWEQLRPGLERRVINLFSESGVQVEHLYLLRVEPVHYQFGVAYHQEPQSLDAWQLETNALILVNGGYFRARDNGTYIPNGLTVVDGVAMGNSYESFAGMLAVTNDGPELRWLAQKPYDPDEPLLAALQSFPLLVKPGGEIGFPEEYEDYLQARRTVIGQDRSGRIILIIASKGYFTLHQLSVYLTGSDLD
ncbi:MAG: phosphodiester glycosidase family protein, partial [Anaerolineaceae bacterium]|nr:phosphodiester glycosidase family protein [Anaerolineaceae bacterium]